MTFEATIETICKSNTLPEVVQTTFLGFCSYYKAACEKANIDPNSCIDVFSTFLQCVAKELQNPYSFGPYHRAIRAPTDYYTLGLDFVRPLVDFKHSMVLGKTSLAAINLAIQNKENVVLLSNHQTEIDPQIISLLIENEYPQLASQMIFVAGHRVVTDPLAIPFSLGRNLICIYSKRHMDTPAEKKAEKIAHNQKALKCLEDLLQEGGKCIYIAPSGGRDRVNENGQPEVSPFDPQSVEMLYLLSQKARHPTHFYTLALATYPLLPPPTQILTEIGETRTTHYSPAHLVFGQRIDMEHVGKCHEESDKKQKRIIRTDAIWQQVVADYQSISNT